MGVGPFDDDFPQYHNATKREHGDISNGLVGNTVIADADLEGSGVEGAQCPLRPTNNQWAIATKYCRGSARPNLTVELYLDTCKLEFGSNTIVKAAS